MSQASLSTRAKIWWASVPLVTRGIFLACTGVYLASALAGWDDYDAVCLAAEPVVANYQLYRFFTAPLLHLGLLHIGFNMMALLPMGASLERTFGSVYFLWLNVVIAALSGAFYVAIAAGASATHLYAGFLGQCAVGYSGVLFGLIVVETHSGGGGGTQRSIFGLFSVPAAAYPWALLAVWTLLVPQASFLGHLSGLLVGQLHAWGLLRWGMPPAAIIHAIERSALVGGWATSTSAFVAYTGRGGAGESSLPGYTLLRSEAPLEGTGVGASGSGRGGVAAGAVKPGGEPARPAAVVLGGTPTELDPKAAAAAAAEARTAQAARRPPAQPPATSAQPMTK